MGEVDGSLLSKSTEQLNRVVRFYRIVLRIALTLILLFFVKSLMSQLPRPTLSSFGAYILLKLSLVGYMYCWFFGCNRDLSVQNDVLRDAPGPAISGVSLVVVMFIAFAFLFYVEAPAVLSPVFLSFLTVNVCGWVYWQRLIRPFTDRAERVYRDANDTVGEVKALIFKDYMCGHWQWWRFAAGFLLLLLLAGTTFSLLPLPAGIPQDVTFALLIFLTFTVLEVWIWYKRLKLKIQWDGLDWLSAQGFIKKSQ